MEEPPTQSFLYETLPALSLPTPNQSPPPPEDLEPYSVFRNEITLSTPQCAPVDTAAPDFFSLDVAADEPDPIRASLSSVRLAEPWPPLHQSEPTTPAPQEPKLESGWFRGHCKFRSPMLQLHKEIVDFCDFLSPTPEEQEARSAAVKRVSDLIKYIFPRSKVEVFGSFKTGLYLPASDIDAVIMGSGVKTPQEGLKALSRALSQMGLAKRIQVIGKARVPIIKFVEKTSGIAFDISFDIEGGPKAAEFIQDAVSKWPPLRPLCLILKVFLQQRELNEVYSGGLGSYALLTMIMAMLHSLRECRPPEQNLGVLLVNFFDFYGRKLNTSDVGVSCNGAGTFFKKSVKGFLSNGRPFLLAIEDPQAPENDVGKNSFNYFQIRSAFSMAYTTLTNPKVIMGLGPNRSILGTIIRPDSALVERKGGPGMVTFNSLLPGAGEPVQLEHDPQELLGNWQFDDGDDPLPRGHDSAAGDSGQSSGKKRKASFKENSGKKGKEYGEVGKKIRYEENGSRRERSRHEENGSRKDKGKKKMRRRRHSQDGANSFGPYGGAWTR
ncbi:terminal nucleotidyltransferase 4A [Pyrus x bretschneideri]|uniref:terminal nucleotidyltransferase 4A n=1 Tax=Pyrus x bretschneideri TaxID=225117 RepID=UPI00203050F9|nr:terminal nucleotidyltransferase 4A [Pyrus x bretschneideri]